MPRAPGSARRGAARALAAATSYAEWLGAAEEYDRLTGGDAWRAEDESPHYDADLLRLDLASLRRLRATGPAASLELADLLTSSLYRHLAELAAPELYEGALAGTKHLVADYLAEVERALQWLAVTALPGIGNDEKKSRFTQAFRVYGRSALMLSGGATWGFHHLGVVKALFEQGVLPQILSGASTGAMIAAGVCVRTDTELADLYTHPEQMRLDGLSPVGLRRGIEGGALLDPERLHDVLRHNIGDYTFAEAWARSGRALNISVSPTRRRQKARLLTHLTTPDVLVASAALASSALPGLFPPVVLEARNAAGERVVYGPNERWVDGSLHEDLPKLRLARLHNVNHFIVSQTNPHVVPFARGVSGVAPAVAGLTTSAARALRRLPGPLGQLADHANALASQDYSGDIDIYPQFRPELLVRIVANPTRADLDAFIRSGERSTWPKIAMITDQTRVGRAFERAMGLL